MKAIILGGTIATLSLFATPILADSGHVIQVHHGHDCIEFTTFEEAAKICGAANVYNSTTGAINPTCLHGATWFGVSDNDQLTFYIAAVQAIDTAYGEWHATNALADVQHGEGFTDNAAEDGLLFGAGSALGYTVDGTVLCGNIDGTFGQKETVSHVGNLNLPPAASN